MKINRIENRVPSFGIKVSPELLEAANKFCSKNNRSPELLNKIYRKAEYMEENYGFNEYTISLKNQSKNGKRTRGLYAEKEGGKISVPLALKDNLQRIFERFIRMSEYELSNKLM